MTTDRFEQRATLLLLLAAALTVAIASGGGCGSSHAYTPTSTSAREALDATLLAWQSGKPPASLASSPTPIQPADHQWLAGFSLASYEILREQPPTPSDLSAKRFTVSLHLTPPTPSRAPKKAPTPRVEEAEYYVIGHAPVLVYRDKDYQQLTDMGDNERPKTPKRR